MAKEQLHSINVEIAGRNYPVFVNREEEKDVLGLAKKLNAEIAQMHSRYVNKLSKQDIMAMLLLTYSKKLQDCEKASKVDGLAEKLDEICLMLDDANPVR